jgi:acetate kinase
MADDKNLILAVNAGSSSLKISLFERTSSSADGDSPIALILTSSVDGLSSPPATFSFAFADKAKADKAIKKEEVKDVHDHTGAFAHFLERLAKEGGIPAARIANVCHRVVHGGDYDRPVVISRDTYHHIERLTDLAPLSALPSPKLERR